MALIRNIINNVRNYNDMRKIKRKNPTCVIRTSNINQNAILGIKCALAENVDIRENVIIGDYSYINKDTIIASGKIGKYCSIGYRCQIGMFEHPYKHMSTSPYTYNKNWGMVDTSSWDEIYSAPIIGNDVWIGSNVVIKQGVTIGDGAVIGAGAVVTKNVEPYSIYAGVPAKCIKMRFNSEQIAYLKKLKWWDLPKEEIKTYYKFFEAKENWVDLIK